MKLACDLLIHFGSLYWLLSAEIEQFRAVGGIGLAKFAQFKAISELARRYHHAQITDRTALLSPEMTKTFLQSQFSDEDREVFIVIFLDNQHRILKCLRMFSSTLSHVEVHP